MVMVDGIARRWSEWRHWVWDFLTTTLVSPIIDLTPSSMPSLDWGLRDLRSDTLSTLDAFDGRMSDRDQFSKTSNGPSLSVFQQHKKLGRLGGGLAATCR